MNNSVSNYRIIAYYMNTN